MRIVALRQRERRPKGKEAPPEERASYKKKPWSSSVGREAVVVTEAVSDGPFTADWKLERAAVPVNKIAIEYSVGR